jgi:uncharacterized protein DUF3800
MKFAYVDETGDQEQSDVFVMCGLVIDAYRLRKCTTQFDGMISSFLARHPGAPKELKTKAFINGSQGWSQVDAKDRKEFLIEICDLAIEYGKIFAVALSFTRFQAADAAQRKKFGNSYWRAGAMFVAALLQRKMQHEEKNKGLTVLICDDNKREMSNLSDALYENDSWFDPIYQVREKRRGKVVWNVKGERFDQIVNCAFAIKSHHSSLIQVADAVSYVYRRHLELKTEAEAWEGEKEYFAGLVKKLDTKRETLGQNPGGPCIEFYKAVSHEQWKL